MHVAVAEVTEGAGLDARKRALHDEIHPFPSSVDVAHFAQAVYRERESGRDAALDFMGLHRTAVAEAERAVADARRQNTGTAGVPFAVSHSASFTACSAL